MPEVIKNLVSTIIPVFNRPEMLRHATESVLTQTHACVEIIIADDGSTDETPNVAKAIAAENPDRIRYVRHENAGPGPARELGRTQARGEFIQYLDSDDLLLPNKFADQIASLRSRPECDIAYGITRLVDSNGDVLADPFKWTAKTIDRLYPGLLVDRWWCTHTPLYRRSLTDRIGPWSDLRWSQDWEYDSRIGALGIKLVHCGSTVSHHVHHSGERQTSDAAWSTDPVRLKNRLRLLNALWNGASVVEVDAKAPERQHFARWCFAIGRNFAHQAMTAEASECFDLAEAAAGPTGPGRKGVSAYRVLLKALGGPMVGRLESFVSRLRKRPGAATMNQSFS